MNNIIFILFLIIFVVLLQKKKENFISKDNKILIIYVFHENKFSKPNLEYFIKNGIINDPNVNYIISINGYNCSIDIPNIKNLTVIKRENTCYDIGTYGVILKNTDLSKYDYFIFLNDTIKGPYIKNNIKWYNTFINQINNKVKLVGISRGGTTKEKNIHVQSMIFCTDKIGLNIILPALNCKKDHNDARDTGEYKISKLITNNNYKIFYFTDVSFTDVPKNYTYKNRYKTIFYKTHWKNKLI